MAGYKASAASRHSVPLCRDLSALVRIWSSTRFSRSADVISGYGEFLAQRDQPPHPLEIVNHAGEVAES